MSNKTKQHDTNRKARAYLTENGFSEIILWPHTRYFKDVWGLWDGVCKYKFENGFHVYWIQVKTGYAITEDRKAMKEFCNKGGQKAILIERVKHSIKYKNRKGSYKRYKLKITCYGRKKKTLP